MTESHQRMRRKQTEHARVRSCRMHADARKNTHQSIYAVAKCVDVPVRVVVRCLRCIWRGRTAGDKFSTELSLRRFWACMRTAAWIRKLIGFER